MATRLTMRRHADCNPKEHSPIFDKEMGLFPLWSIILATHELDHSHAAAKPSHQSQAWVGSG